MKRSLPGVRRGAMAYTLVVVTMVCGTVILEAQQVTSVGSVFQDIGADSAASALLPEANSVTPGGAFLRAVLVPGWGHVSIGAHTRARVYFALESAVAYGIIRSAMGLNMGSQEVARFCAVITAVVTTHRLDA